MSKEIYLKVFESNDIGGGENNNPPMVYESRKWNEDVLPFNDNPQHSCCPGGLYYTNISNIHHFIFGGYGSFIRIVKPNKDYRFIIKDPDRSMGEKWRTNKLFLYDRKSLKETSTWSWLIKLGFDIEAKNGHGNTALLWAFMNEYRHIVKYLIKKGANVNAKSHLGYTALFYASEQNDEQLVKLLIDKGIDINATEISGYTALNIAEKRSHKKIVKILKEEIEKGEIK